MNRLLLLGALALVSSSAFSAQIFINSPQLSVGTVTATRWTAKYRLSHLNYDQSITLPSETGVTANLGNNNALSGQDFQISLENIVGQGLRFKTTKVVGGAVTTVSWGSSTLGGTNVANIGGVTPFSGSYNALKIGTRAISSGGNPNPSLIWSNLIFTGLPTVGAFTSGTVTPSTGDVGNLGNSTQYAVAGADLSNLNWSITGTVRGTRAGANDDEITRFTVEAQQVSPVPEPATLGVLALGLFAAVRRRRA